MTFETWFELAENYAWKYQQRRGQGLFNALWAHRQDLAGRIIRPNDLPGIDPFYDDDKIPAFLEFVKENW